MTTTLDPGTLGTIRYRSTNADRALCWAHVTNGFVTSKACEVVDNKMEILLASVGVLWSGPICTRNYRHRYKISLFFWSEWAASGLWSPFIDELVNLLADRRVKYK